MTGSTLWLVRRAAYEDPSLPMTTCRTVYTGPLDHVPCPLSKLRPFAPAGPAGMGVGVGLGTGGLGTTGGEGNVGEDEKNGGEGTAGGDDEM